MKIGMISLYLPSGSKIGSGYQAHYMANAMVRRGHCVTMFSPCTHPEDALYKTVTIPVGRKLRTFRFAWNLRGVDFSGFDVLHAHGDDYCLFGKQRGIHVRTMHGSCLAEALHVPGLFEKLRMFLLGISEIVATSVADRTVCVSQNTLRQYPWLNHVIMNGVDTSEFRPSADVTVNPTILFVGTYHNRKRGKLLMEKFEERIRPEFPNAELWMVCRDAPAAPGVRVFGGLPLGDLAELFRRAWIFCLPSSYEGFGVPYIEAMASGTPVVATPNAGACEVLCGGEFGVIVEPEELGAHIVALLKDPSRRAELRRKGLERSCDFAWDNVVSQYEGYYTELENRRNSTACNATAR